MSAYKYKAYDPEGKPVTGEVVAATVQEAEAKLASQRLSPVYLVQGGKSDAKSAASGSGESKLSAIRLGKKKTSVDDICDLLRSLSIMARSGVPLVDSLETLLVNASHEGIREVVESMKADVLGGKSLAIAMGAHPLAFPDIVCEMVGVSDEGGRLADALEAAMDYLEQKSAVKKTVTSALVYPVMLLGICGLTFLGFLVFIMPTFAQTFEGMNVKLPAITQMLLGFGQFLQKNLLIVGIGGIVLGGATPAILKLPKVRAVVTMITYRTPLVGPLVKSMALARSTSTLASLTSTNIPIIRAIEYAGKVAYYPPLVEAFDGVRLKVENGGTLAESMQTSDTFPPMAVQLVSVGERSGRLSDMLHTASRQIQSQAERRLKAVLVVLEPLLILAMGAIIGTLTLSILLPLFSLNQSIR